MAGILTKGIKLSYAAGTSSVESYTDLTNLQEIPDMGGSTDSVEVTTLMDGAHMYIAGLKDYGDSIDFTFLYEPTQFTALNTLIGDNSWKLSLPDGIGGAIDTTCTFTRECSVRLLGKTYNDAMQYTLSIKPTSEMVWG